MILSDNETNADMLNNRSIAICIKNLILDSADKPLSVGVHGDWGAGKSSVLEMVATEIKSIEKDKKIAYIKFNGWKHQGFEDAKVALMAAIVSELDEHYKVSEKAKDIFEKIWKNINWMSVAKNTGKLAVSAITGTAPLTILTSAFSVLKSGVKNEEKVSSTIESIGNYLEEAKIFKDTSTNKEFTEFQKNFEELLEKSDIKKLVVLIDDLDRCLPNVAIETLEAVRLFMFTKATAFVIAADESMIRYAVKKHFPDATTGSDSPKNNFSDKYLEKLIQVPFRIPSLGEVESAIYITLLLVGSKLDVNSTEYKALLDASLGKLKKPWQIKNFTTPELKEILKDKYEPVSEEVFIAMQVCSLLAKNTQGNPRKIKRFLNMLFLRQNIAHARGYGNDLDLSVLAKMMIAEYYYQTYYKEIASETNQLGVCPFFEKVENKKKNSEFATQEKGEQQADETLLPDWAKDDGFKEWITLEPSLIDVDLRPYYFVSKEKEDYFFHNNGSEKIQKLFDSLMGTEMQIAGMGDQIKTVTQEEAEAVYELITEKIIRTTNFSDKPKGMEGLKALVTEKGYLQTRFVTFLKSIPDAQIGVWICSGWDNVFIKDTDAKTQFDSYVEYLKTAGNDAVKSILRSTRKGKK